MDELYQLPDGWEWKKLDNVCNRITDGTHKSPKIIEDGNPYITVKDIDKNGNINFDNCKLISNEDFQILIEGNCMPENGDILFSKDGTVGKVALVDYDIKFVVLSSLAILKPSDIVISNFLCRFLQSPLFLDKAIKSKTGAAIKRVVLRTIKTFMMPLPPLDEQKRIVSKLDDIFSKLDRAIQLNQENIDEANAYMNSVLNEVFSEFEEKYEKVQLKDIVDNFDGKRVPVKASDRESMSGEYPYYGASGIIDYVDDYLFDGEYLLISEDGANLTVRKYPIAFIANGKFWVNNHAHIVNAKIDISTNRFMEYAFAYTYISSYITGSAQPKMSQGKMNIIEFAIPPLEKQKKIVAYLDDISLKMDKIKSLQIEKLQELKALKASILDTAFRGEL